MNDMKKLSDAGSLEAGKCKNTHILIERGVKKHTSELDAQS